MCSLRARWWASACALAVCACGDNAAEQTIASAPTSTHTCLSGDAVETDGHRRLALIVGVGEYANGNVPDLDGPPNDARRVYELLTGERGYGFPRANVCLLLNEQATTASFRQAFQDALIARARPQDVAVFYFAGHGSQAKDTGGDEPDGWDETFMLHDARTQGVSDLRDDELNTLLASLHAKTQHITLVFDSCNSGTATRADSRLVARFFEPAEPSEEAPGLVGDGDEGPAAKDLSGVIAFTAASDGTPALERDGKGIFTDALIQVLGQASDGALTYAQAARQVPPLVSAASYQIPYFQGDLQRPVFGAGARTRPLGWDVTSPGPPVELAGPPMPGVGIGAELRIYDGSVTGDAVHDPGKAKATVVVTALGGLNARAAISTASPGAPAIRAGDLAVLARTADEFLKIKVRLRRGPGAGGIAKDRADAIERAVREHPEAALLVELVDRGEDFELSAVGDGRLVLRGPENRVRNAFDDDREVPDSLWRHARQRALLQLRGEGGADFVDNETLQVQLVPAPRQSACADGQWQQSPPNEEQVIPLCHAWNVKVALSPASPEPLLIGAVIVSADGAMFGLPKDGRAVRLQPGESVIFDKGETFRGTPPLDTQDKVLVFGTQERNPVEWHLLTQAVSTRGAPPAGLYRALYRYLRPGTRGIGAVEELEEATWTMTTLGVRVEANLRFLDAVRGAGIRTREYTIPNFDVRPYLPDNPDSALRKVLETADWLARASVADGINYKQHDWALASDEANLARGIDCSRSIWFAFTRAGLTYNRDDLYLYTGLMVGDNTWMQDEFARCPENEQFQTGDVLVYRSDTRGDGHTVMVIDAEKRIAWGSHGWDGEAKDSGYAIQPDTGVEYQRIKYKPDWERWDRKDMAFKECWRYRKFTAEAGSGQGLPGITALGAACDDARCRL